MTTNSLFGIAGALVIVAAISAAQWLEADDLDQALADEHTATIAQMRGERRTQMQAVLFCQRTAGPQTSPVEDAGGNLRCVGKRGQKHPAVEVASK